MNRNALEGGGRLANIRRTKTYLYVIQTLFALAIAIYLIVSGDGFSLKPFYLPINSFLYFILIMGLVISVEGFIFRGLEMRFIKSASPKYYMAKMAQRRAAAIVLLAGLLFLVIFTPYMQDGAEDLMSEERTVVNTTDFLNKDPLGMVTVTSLTLSSEDAVEVYLVSDDNYEMYAGDIEMLRLHRINSQYQIDGQTRIDLPSAEMDNFHIVVSGGEATVMLERNISQTFLDFFPLMMLFYAIVYGGWFFYLMPVKREYSKRAIYT